MKIIALELGYNERLHIEESQGAKQEKQGKPILDNVQ